MKCKTPECDKEAQWKGICRSCYGQALKLIEKGETTWEELYKMGLINVEIKPFTKLFHEKKSNT